MKKYFPLLKWAMIACLSPFPILQLVGWGRNGALGHHNTAVSVLWSLTVLLVIILMADMCFGTNPAKHKFRCVFYGFHKPMSRICTRSYNSIWKYCFVQMFRSRSFFFTMKQLDS